MATPFSDIYERAIFRFADYDFLKHDIGTRDTVLQSYLMSAKTEFKRICGVDLNDYDLEKKQFNQDLDDEEKEILALGISFYWVSFKVMNSEMLRNVLNSKEYHYYSPANLLKETQELRKTIRKEFYSRMRQYSYNDKVIGSLKP